MILIVINNLLPNKMGSSQRGQIKTIILVRNEFRFLYPSCSSELYAISTCDNK